MNEQSLAPIIEKLESLFSTFNDYFYQGELQKPVITVSPNKTRRGSYLGWCTSWKVWGESSGESEGMASDNDNDGYYEINICSEFLSRSFEESCCTLIHEMAHLCNAQIGVQDTCRSGIYHNKKFKETAEAHGLIVTRHETRGFCITELNEKAASFIRSLDGTIFQVYRKRIQRSSASGKKSSTRKYVCWKCGLIIRATREVHVICAECSVELTLMS